MPADDPPPPAHRRLTGLGGWLGALRSLAPVRAGRAGGAAAFEFFDASDGQPIPVRVLGSGPPVVLVHGLACSHRHWMPVARRLARRRCVLAWDARGHGLGRPLQGEGSLARMGSDLAELLDHGHVDGLEAEQLPVDVDVYGMDDNLHMHDLKHTPRGASRGPGKGGRQ